MSGSTDSPDVQKVLSLPQRFAGFIGDHLKWMQDMLVDGVTLNAILADLGLPPGQSPRPQPDSIKGHLESIDRYRQAADPDEQALRSVLDDIFAVYDSVSSVIQAVSDDSDDVKKELAAGLLNLLLLNYLRLRYNWLYKTGQLAAFLTYPFWHETGPGVLRFVDSLTHDPLIRDHRASADKDFDFDIDRKLETEEDAKFWSDLLFTPLAGALGYLGNKKEEQGTVGYFPDFLATKNLIYGWDGLDASKTPVADKLSRRTLTIAFEYPKTEGTGEDAAKLTAALNVTLLLVPRSDGGPGIFVTIGGAEEIDAPISEKWRLKFKASANGTLDFLIPIHFKDIKNTTAHGSADASASLRIQSETDEAEHSYVIPKKTGTRLELGKFSFTLEINADGAGFEASAEDGTLVISGDDCDGFTAKSLPAEETRIGVDLGFGVSSEKGFYIKGGTGLQAVIPIGKTLGPVTIQQLLLKLVPTTDPKPAKLAVEASAALNVKLGPVTASIDQIGFQMALPFARTGGKYDFAIGLKPPNGVGLSIDSAAVTGGGFLFYDSEKEQYGGVVDLKLEKSGIELKAVGLIATRLPDHTKGFSLIVIITAEGFKPFPLGLDFFLTGIGGLVAVNRTFDEGVLRAGLKNHTLDSVMFPEDPVRNAPQIISNLNGVFPPANGHYLFGLMAQIAWGMPPVITADLGVVLELGARLRLLILARVVAGLPNKEIDDALHLQMDAVGVLDFDQGTASLDAALHDSRLVKRFVLTGDMAMRLKWGSPRNFALAVGGLHPAFNPPPNFPKLERIAINLAAGDNPRLRAEAYFALTANTVQFGARAELYAAAAGFSIQGEIGYDVLIQFDPFHFLADFYEQLQLKHGSTNLFKVRVEGALAGPRPLHIKAKATFEILWWDVSIRVDKTLVEGELPPRPEPVDVLPQLKETLANPGSWTGRLPDGQRPMVTLRATRDAATELLVHPLGTLMVKQGVVPLNLEISSFGQATPAGARLFTISNVSLGGQNQTTQSIQDFFAPAQFFEMSDDEKLSRPSFEPMTAGVSFGSDEFVFTDNADDWLEAEAIEYETITVDKQTNEPRRSGPKDLYKLSPELLGKHARFGAAGASDLRRTGNTKYRTTTDKYRVVKEGWSVVATADLSVQPVPGIEAGKPATYSEAAQALRKMRQQDPTKAGGLKILRLSELR
jgi:hypothetical protein